jgi:flavin-dependent dehydrogenase
MDAPRVAVVGSGLAGLAAAYLLRREGADVWLIEKVRHVLALIQSNLGVMFRRTVRYSMCHPALFLSFFTQLQQCMC